MSFDNLEQKRVKARKEHRCDWCRCRIKKGEEYKYNKNVQDGDIYTWKECDRCKEFVKEMFEKGYGVDKGYCTQADFDEFMNDEHKEILKEWEMEGAVPVIYDIARKLD